MKARERATILRAIETVRDLVERDGARQRAARPNIAGIAVGSQNLARHRAKVQREKLERQAADIQAQLAALKP